MFWPILFCFVGGVQSFFHFVRLDIQESVEVFWDPDGPDDNSTLLYRIPHCPYCNFCGLYIMEEAVVVPADFAAGRVADKPFACNMLVQPTIDFFDADSTRFGNLAGDDCTVFSCPVCLALDDSGVRPVPSPMDIMGPDGLLHRSAFRMDRSYDYWDSQGLTSTMIGILLQEYAGVAVDYTHCHAESVCFLAVQGCAGWRDGRCTEVVRTSAAAQRAHAAGLKLYNDPLPDSFCTVELTASSIAPGNFVPSCKAASPGEEDCYALEWAAQLASDGGVSGFTTQDGIYAAGAAVEAAWNASRLVLTSWRDFTEESYLPYFDVPQTAMDKGIVAERPGCWTEEDVISGAVPSGGTDLAAARQMRSHGYRCVDSWWLTPACWEAYGEDWKTKCAIVWNDDWHYVKYELFAAITEMRVAVLAIGYEMHWIVATGDNVVEGEGDRRLEEAAIGQGYAFQAMFTWWNLDSWYYSVNPVRINLPYKKEVPHKLCTKKVYQPALNADRIVDSIVRKAGVTVPVMQDFLENELAVGWIYATYYFYDYYAEENWYGETLHGIDAMNPVTDKWSRRYFSGVMRKYACSFLRENPDIWKEWLPAPGSCKQGSQYDAAQKECVPCQAGEYGALHVDSGLMVCRSCDVGTFQVSQGSTACDTCLPGSMASSEGQSLCEMCREGTFSLKGASTCSSCELGKYQPAEGSDHCGICGPGTFTNRTRSTSCSRCDVGRFQQNEGASSCLFCNEQISGSSTLSTGTTSSKDCGCDVGFFENRSGGVCQECLEGEVCDTFGIYIPDLQPGYSAFSANEDNFAGNSVWKCLSTADCPGGAPGYCPPGRDAGVVACAVCQPDFYLYNSECFQCHELESSGLLFPTTPLVLGPLVVLVMHYKMQDTPQQWGLPNRGFPIAFYIALLQMQSISLIKKCDIMLPGSVSGTWSFFDQFNSMLDVFHPDCSYDATFSQRFGMTLVMPVGVLALFLATYAALWPFRGFISTRFAGVEFVQRLLILDRDHLSNCFWAVINTFFMAIASASMGLFRCYRHPTGDLSLQIAPEVFCFSEAWYDVLLLGIIGAVGLCILPFSLFSYVAWVAPTRFGDIGFQKRWKFVFSKFQADSWWWGLLIMMKGLLMNLTLVISREGLLQTYMLLFIFCVYNTGVLLRRPWRHEGMDSFDGLCNVSLIIVAAIAAKFASVSDYLELFVTYTLLSASLVSIVHLAGAVAVFFRLQTRLPHRLREADTFMEELKTIFQVVVKTDCLPVVDFKSGVIEKPLAEWWLTLGANDRRTLEKTRTLLVAEFVGHQARRSKGSQRLIAGSQEGKVIWDGQESGISEKNKTVVEYMKRQSSTRLSRSTSGLTRSPSRCSTTSSSEREGQAPPAPLAPVLLTNPDCWTEQEKSDYVHV